MDELGDFAQRVKRDEYVRSAWLFWLGFAACILGVCLAEWLRLPAAGVSLGVPLLVWCGLRAFNGKPTPSFKMWIFGFRGGFWARYGRGTDDLSPAERIVHARFTGFYLFLISAVLITFEALAIRR